MNCVDCGSEKASIIFVEVFPCNHCNEEIHLEYNLCPECGSAWKSLDGEVSDGDTLVDENIDDFFIDFNEFPDVLDLLINHLKYDEGNNSMNSYVHKCLKCNSVAYEVGEGLYKCSDDDCGFEWEVVADE